jgi:predicted TIM-barrel fold metal-dependent hydrolase
MTAISQKDRITRRGFIERGAGALASPGVLGGINAASAANDALKEVGTTVPDSPAITGKIALEEHFGLSETAVTGYAASGTPEIRLKLEEIGSGRVAEMDRGGVEFCLLSLTAPGIQAIPDSSQAVSMSRRANDHLAEHIAKYPKRLRGFAALPLQDPQAAARELTRCVKELGFCGALVNGFSQIGEADSAVYL